jgi:hypothetical protein
MLTSSPFLLPSPHLQTALAVQQGIFAQNSPSRAHNSALPAFLCSATVTSAPVRYLGWVGSVMGVLVVAAFVVVPTCVVVASVVAVEASVVAGDAVTETGPAVGLMVTSLHVL